MLLFGSHAYGTPSDDSDIDLFVVLNNDTLPATFKEKQDLYLSVSSKLHAFSTQVPVDLLVFTVPMFEQFKKLESSFSREILSKGIILYEDNNTAMA